MQKPCKIIFSLGIMSVLFAGCSDESLATLEEKANKTSQNALEDSGLKDTVESKAKEFNEFMESGKTQEFIDKQTQILQDGADALGKIIESDTTKELLQRQMENLNEILSDKNSDKNKEVSKENAESMENYKL